MQEAVPVRAKGVHFIRMSPAFNTVHSLIVGFATEKIRKRVMNVLLNVLLNDWHVHF